MPSTSWCSEAVVDSPASCGYPGLTGMSQIHGTVGLRASDADREEAVERLRVAAVEGRLTSDELEDRLGAAYAARWCAELARLTADVTPPAARRVAPPEFVHGTRRVNRLAIVSLLIGLFWVGGAGALLAVVLGHMALRQIRRADGASYGRVLAVVGLTAGYFKLVLLAVLAIVGIVF